MEQSTTWNSVREHLPIAALVLAAGALAIGLHTALTALVVVAAGHLVIAVLLAVIARRRRRPVEEATAGSEAR